MAIATARVGSAYATRIGVAYSATKISIIAVRTSRARTVARARTRRRISTDAHAPKDSPDRLARRSTILAPRVRAPTEQPASN